MVSKPLLEFWMQKKWLWLKSKPKFSLMTTFPFDLKNQCLFLGIIIYMQTQHSSYTVWTQIKKVHFQNQIIDNTLTEMLISTKVQKCLVFELWPFACCISDLSWIPLQSQNVSCKHMTLPNKPFEKISRVHWPVVAVSMLLLPSRHIFG